ncbi:glycosyl hydrolase [Mucilaginibacter daejeonensis]|uniref:glycoside hydrolase family 30 protein n=1 Tax=Mucilaginibacter daejeonensis TaxID=398049 RepID=UPI001D17B16F|nr:glycoside hydrolase family 30 protein [Mucilaginibacter daejeonensis]UEG51626.1 glycosyl hydrolase [Mucilaginibacter daejeonensis]
MKNSILMPLLMASAVTAGAQTRTAAKKTPAKIGDQVKVYVTAKGTDDRFKLTETLNMAPVKQPVETQISIFVDPSKTFQTMIGVGGALTDAAAETYAKLSPEKKREFLTAYYDKEKGIGYSWARTHIQSCDFSSDTYSYVKDNDASLKSFDISHDKKYRIPFIKDAQKVAGGFKMFVSPWSPPAWMKDNNNMLRGGKLKPEYRQTWALMYTKFIRSYEKEGIPIWALSVQNEPMAVQKWESCVFTAEEERDFVKNYLGPTLKKEGLADKKLIIWDHNRDLLYQRASTVLEDPQAAKYVWGVGYHWYETWTGAGMNFESTRRVHEAFPNTNLVFTEGCVEKFDFNRLDDWSLGERYGYSMINDLNAGTVAWTDWNVLLDEKGGPNHVGNFCFAPIHADTRDGSLHYTSEYYYIGHISKYIRPGAKRIVSSASREKLLTTAYLNTDGKIAVVVMNPIDTEMNYTLWVKGKGVNTKALPHSIATLVIQ